VRIAHGVRLLVNVVNTSTLLGLVIGVLGRARFTAGPEGLILGYRYRLPIPPAPAFTVGNVVMHRDGPVVHDRRPTLLTHESRHATQYAFCIGHVMMPLYLLAAAWSWLRAGDTWSRNAFETRAGLLDGGYSEHPLRSIFSRNGRL
jgi:hypothetical protein